MDAAKTAEMFLRNLQTNYRPAQEFRIVDGSRFPHVRQAFYRRVEDELGELGFSVLGDIENVTLAKYGKPDPRTFTRVMTDADRTTMALFFHFAPYWWWKIALWLLGFNTRVVELESRSDDGYWAITTTTSSKTQQPYPEKLATDYAPRTVSTKELYERHRRTIEESRRTYKRIATIEDAIALEAEQHSMKRQFLVDIGWVTPEYLASQGVPASHVDAVYRESQRLLKAGFDASMNS